MCISDTILILFGALKSDNSKAMDDDSSPNPTRTTDGRLHRLLVKFVSATIYGYKNKQLMCGTLFNISMVDSDSMQGHLDRVRSRVEADNILCSRDLGAFVPSVPIIQVLPTVVPRTVTGTRRITFAARYMALRAACKEPWLLFWSWDLTDTRPAIRSYWR